MKDLQYGEMTKAPDYITSHLENFKRELENYQKKLMEEYEEYEKENDYLKKFLQADATGRCSKKFNKSDSTDKFSSLTGEEKLLISLINQYFSWGDFFVEERGRLYNRNQIYYTVHEKDPRSLQGYYTCIVLTTNLFLLQRTASLPSGSFIIASILDDIRYKFILIYEDILENRIEINGFDIESLTNEAIKIYYSYLLLRPQTTISYVHLQKFLIQARKFIDAYLLNFGKDHSYKEFKKYKEADIPFDNMLFIHKLKKNLPTERIHFIIGIRFGGIELPYLIKQFIYPDAEIKHVRISNHSDPGAFKIPFDQELVTGKNVLIVDDGITSGKTVQLLIDVLKKFGCKNIFFACVYFSGTKRLKHMQKKGEGGFNVEQLEKCCVLKEQKNFTRSINKLSFTNKSGVFDKNKFKINRRTAQQRNARLAPLKKGSRDNNRFNVFIVCDRHYINDEYFGNIEFTWNYFETTDSYKILDNWIYNRVSKEGTIQYREIEGRDFLSEAITDIDNADGIVFICPGRSSYVSLLFADASLKQKRVLIIYKKKEEVAEFAWYPYAQFISIKYLRRDLNQISWELENS